jgi:tight adherence protein C
MDVIALVAGLILFGFAVMTVIRALTLPSRAEVVDQIGAYGYEPTFTSTAEVEERDRRSLEDVAQSVGALFTRKTRQARENDVRRRLIASGQYDASPRAFMVRQLLLAVAVLLIWIAVATLGGTSGIVLVLGIVIAPLFGWSLPSILLSRKIKTRFDQIDRELPALIDLLVVTVEAGIGFVGSLRRAAEQLEGPLAQELKLALQEQNMGRSTTEAIQGMAGRADTPGIRAFTRAIVQGEQLGVSIGQILRNLASEMRKKRKAAAEEQAQKAPVKMLFPLVLLIFPAMFVVLLLPAIISISNTLSG